ncbi:hypothetical protein ACRAWD_12975 [Caulobacter segnis]
MLGAIGVKSIDDLFVDVPASARRDRNASTCRCMPARSKSSAR